MTKTIQRHNLRTVHQAVENRSDFICNNTLRGGAAQGGLGRLPQRYADDYLAAYSTPDFYAIYSYATPIAWFANGKWTVPEVKYSPTTSRHQSAILRGINL